MHPALALNHCNLGANAGLGDGLGRCRRLLSCEQRDRIGGQRGERPPFHSASGPNDAEEHFGHQNAARDPKRP